MLHTGAMAQQEEFLTFRGIAVAIGTALMDRLACARKGHDPVTAGRDIFCRRCLHRVP